MASLSSGIPISLTSLSPSLHQISQISTISKPSNKHCLPRTLSCKASITNDNNLNPTNDVALQNPNLKIDRRSILLGLGGIGSLTSLCADPFSFAAPISVTDLSQCSPASQIMDFQNGCDPTQNCCPPVSSQIIDFQLPTPGKLRVRPPAHAVNYCYITKFKRAVELMKALPDHDPRNFKQQANIHCAYCDGVYKQVQCPELTIDVHASWLFFPFHRCYLYFFERILGKLIDDPDFAMPFWNWDAGDGMQIPVIYTDKNSPLYDELRNKRHQPPTLIDLNYNGHDRPVPPEIQILRNLTTMYRQVVLNRCATLFMGEPYRARDAPDPGAGSLELVPHNTVHNWTGDNTLANKEDMGIFYSAARDPIFYAHHSNVDRMWNIWKSLGRQDFNDTDWLDAAFLFYDENAQLVRIKVRDCLDTTMLGYTYEDVPVPWLYNRPTPRRRAARAKRAIDDVGVASFPLTVDKTVKTLVSRPKKYRSKKEKDEAAEVLVIKGIEFDRNERIKFDVFINEDDHALSGPDKSEFAGSFVNVPHGHKSTTNMNTSLRLNITEILEDLDAEGDENVLVTLVPGIGNGLVRINGGLKIEFVS